MPKNVEIAQDDAPLGVHLPNFFALRTAPSIDLRAAAVTSRRATVADDSRPQTRTIAVQPDLLPAGWTDRE